MDVYGGSTYLDHQIDVIDVDAEDPDYISLALETINGGSRVTMTHMAVAAYKKNDRLYFAQTVAREVSGGNFDLLYDKSTAWGQKGNTLANSERA